MLDKQPEEARETIEMKARRKLGSPLPRSRCRTVSRPPLVLRVYRLLSASLDSDSGQKRQLELGLALQRAS